MEFAEGSYFDPLLHCVCHEDHHSSVACGKQFEVRLSGAGLNVASSKGLFRRNDESENVHVLEIRTASLRDEKIADTDMLRWFTR